MPRTWTTLGLLASSTLVVLLGVQNHRLESKNRDLLHRTTGPYRGMIVPTVRSVTLAGDSVTLGDASETGARQLLFIFTTGCGFCRASLPAWDRLAEVAHEPGNVRTDVFGVSLDSLAPTRRYAAEHQLRYPVAFLDAKNPVLFRAQKVPILLLLDQWGRTIYARRGMLDDSLAVDSVIRILRIHPRPKAPDSTAGSAPTSPRSS